MSPIDDFYTSFSAFLKYLTPYYPLILVLSGLILAVFIDLLIKRLKSYIIRNKIVKQYQTYRQIPFAWQSLKILFTSVRVYVYFWIFLISTYAAIILSGYLKTSNEIVYKNRIDQLNTIFFVLFVLSITWASADISSRIISARSKVLASTSILISIVRISIYLIGLLVLLRYFNQDITWLLGTLGIAGLAVALALQDTLSNFFAGLYIIASRQIKPGHYIKLDSGEEGIIVDVNWRSTTLRALPNHIVIIPNSKIGKATITNFNLPSPPVNVYIAIGVHYDSDLKQVEKICIDVARELIAIPELNLDPSYDPTVRYNTFSDSSINFNVIVRALDYLDQFKIKHEYIKTIHARFKQEGITIPYPIRTIEFATDSTLNDTKDPT